MSYYALTRRSLASSHHGVCQPVWLNLAAQNAPPQRFLYSYHSTSSHLLSYRWRRLLLNVSEFNINNQSEIKQAPANALRNQSDIKQAPVNALCNQSEIKQAPENVLCNQSEIKQAPTNALCVP